MLSAWSATGPWLARGVASSPARRRCRGVIATGLGLAVVTSAMWTAPAADASSSDVEATRAYVQADYRLMQSAVRRIPAAEGSLERLLGRVRATCPDAAAGSPQNPMSTQLSNEVVGAMVLTVVDQGLPLARAFVDSTQHLRWSDAQLTSQVRRYVANVSVLADLHPPSLCADVGSWAASGYSSLPAVTDAFDARFMPAWVAAGELPGALSAYESASTRALAQQASALEGVFSDFEARAVETWGKIMDALELWP